MSDQQETSKDSRARANPEDQDIQAKRLSPRRTFKRLTAAFALLVGIAAFGGLVLQIRARSPRPESVARVGRALPVIPVTDASGQVWDVSKAGIGAKTIIVFYSTTCDVCEKELPKLRPFPPGLRLIMVNEVDNSSDEIDRLGLPYTGLFHDRDRVFKKLSFSPALPTILFVNEQGVLSGALVGEHSPEVLQGKLMDFAAAHTQSN